MNNAQFGIGDLLFYAGIVAFVISRIMDGRRRGHSAVDKLVQSKTSPMSLPSGLFLGVAALGLLLMRLAG